MADLLAGLAGVLFVLCRFHLIFYRSYFNRFVPGGAIMESAANQVAGAASFSWAAAG